MSTTTGSTSYKPISSIASPSLSGFGAAVTALSFDPVSDILWTGSDSGSVSACYGTQGVRGVSFRVGGNTAVKKIVAGDNYIRALGTTSAGFGSWSKGGMNKWFFTSPTDVVTFSNTSHTSHFLAASLVDLEMVFLSSMTGSIIRQVKTTSLLTHLELSHSMLLSGSSDGYLRVHDPRTGMGRTGTTENLVKAHSSSIEGIQTAGNFAFTIGMGERHLRPFPDPLVKVYDLRTMRPLPPIPFSAAPAFIHVLPKRSSSLAIMSNHGLINIVDASNPSGSSEFYQLDLTSSYLTCAAISPNGAYMAFGDAEGTVHLMSQAESNVPFNGYDGQPVPWADTPAPLPPIQWNSSTPLNSIGLPHFDNELLSAWPSYLSSKPVNYSAPPRIPPDILISMKTNDNVTYAAFPKELRGRRNMITVAPRRENARFRSGKLAIPDAGPGGAVFDDRADGEIPRIYCRVEIEYSKFGVEDFDFGFYNQTSFSGLETHILNSYTNAVVQVMHYVSPIRELAKAHILIDCPREHCLFCELGFVFRMLEDAQGTNCQASNFCKTVGVLAQASNAIELIDYGREATGVDYAQKIQAFHRFLVDHLSSEGNAFPHNPSLLPRFSHSQLPSPSPISQLIGVDGKNIITCSHCKDLREKDNLIHVIDLVYSRKPPTSEQPIDFASILQTSLFRTMAHKATCQNCRQYTTFTTCRSLSSVSLPPFLAVNASVYNEESLNFWQDSRSQKFLQPRVYLHGQARGIDDSDRIAYAVRAMVVQVTMKQGESHLVAIIQVPEAESLELSSPWFLFNDFVVKNISEQEALSFQDKWKVPAIIYLEREDLQNSFDFGKLSHEPDSTILIGDTSISLNRNPALIKHVLLQPDELPIPGKGTLVSIDAEFVLMQQEETEFRSDGTKKVLRPARLSLARVSVLRGDGPRQGLPFIDDYIHTSEIIVDYLTEFSGIKYGDLDPIHSHYTLTPLKLVYKKLRRLVDCRCIFIGHGLSKDFRIINIYVPPDQVIDTVDLYFLKSRQRRLSLRFLSWFILGEHIQTDNHDSIEDARSALMLYHAYRMFEEEGIFDQKLEEVYKEGRQFVRMLQSLAPKRPLNDQCQNFKPPTPLTHLIERK
ncbi:hypothetical protein BYT27DRAFT_7246743 [Phlegmacium glaucopus]|nr:hypothetical protein BYT27DRAFT_7246743 [Phlegmacium glaucopus]